MLPVRAGLAGDRVGETGTGDGVVLVLGMGFAPWVKHPDHVFFSEEYLSSEHTIIVGVAQAPRPLRPGARSVEEKKCCRS